MKSKKAKLGKLSETEYEVMREIWELATPVTVPQLMEVFIERRGWKSSTLSTIMDRLIDKGFLSITRHGKPNIYTALLNEAAYKEHETEAFLLSVHNGSLKSFVSALSDGAGISADELAEIRAWFLSESEGGK